MKKQRVVGRPWRKGQSGNPRGRPRVGLSVAEAIRALGGEDGRRYIQVLHRLAVGRHTDTRAKLVAIQLLLDRAFGRPVQAVDMEMRGYVRRLTPEEARHLTDEELELAIRLGERVREIQAVSERAEGRESGGEGRGGRDRLRRPGGYPAP
jgi:hypothetical protein